MVRQKVSELSTGAQVDNVILFLGSENEEVKLVKADLGLKQCGATRSCITNNRQNPYKCEEYAKCKIYKEILKIFM